MGRIRFQVKTHGNRALTLAGLVLMAVGLGFTLKPLYHLARRQALELYAVYDWRHRIRAQIPSSGKPVAWLYSEDADLNTPILWNGTEGNLDIFPCMSVHGVLPGSLGTVIIQGHRDAHFRRLARLAPGDRVCLETLNRKKIRYQVARVEVMSIREMEEKLRDRYRFQGMVLATCYPFRFAGPAPQRYLVWLRELDRPVPEALADEVALVSDRTEEAGIVGELYQDQNQ